MRHSRFDGCQVVDEFTNKHGPAYHAVRLNHTVAEEGHANADRNVPVNLVSAADMHHSAVQVGHVDR